MARKYETSKEYSEKPDVLYKLILRTLRNCGFYITQENKMSYEIQGRVKRSLWSWGKEYIVFITSADDNSEVHFSSKCLFSVIPQYTGGEKNKRNAKAFYKTLDELVDLYKEITEKDLK